MKPLEIRKDNYEIATELVQQIGVVVQATIYGDFCSGKPELRNLIEDLLESITKRIIQLENRK